jgi:hypothetical protein
MADRMGGMSGLGDLLELMQTAHMRAGTVRAVLHKWSDQGLWLESARRWRELSPGTSQTSHTVGVPGPAILEESYRVWRDSHRDAWRVDREGSGETTTILDGRRWWMLAETAVAASPDQPGWAPFAYRAGDYITNIGPDAEVDQGIGGGLPDRFIELMLDPASLLSSSVLRPTSRGERAGRPTIEAVAQWRTGIDLLYIDWPYADQIRLSVDVEYGALLRLAFLLDSEPFLRIEAKEIAFNEVLPGSLFQGPPPTPGEQRLPDPTAHAPHLPRRVSREQPDTL